jgi:hypothetical protein
MTNDAIQFLYDPIIVKLLYYTVKSKYNDQPSDQWFPKSAPRD